MGVVQTRDKRELKVDLSTCVRLTKEPWEGLLEGYSARSKNVSQSV
jgi:hypothetical protein